MDIQCVFFTRRYKYGYGIALSVGAVSHDMASGWEILCMLSAVLTATAHGQGEQLQLLLANQMCQVL